MSNTKYGAMLDNQSSIYSIPLEANLELMNDFFNRLLEVSKKVSNAADKYSEALSKFAPEYQGCAKEVIGSGAESNLYYGLVENMYKLSTYFSISALSVKYAADSLAAVDNDLAKNISMSSDTCFSENPKY